MDILVYFYLDFEILSRIDTINFNKNNTIAANDSLAAIKPVDSKVLTRSISVLYTYAVSADISACSSASLSLLEKVLADELQDTVCQAVELSDPMKHEFSRQAFPTFLAVVIIPMTAYVHAKLCLQVVLRNYHDFFQLLSICVLSIDFKTLTA